MTNFQQILQMGQQVQARLNELQSELVKKTVTCTSGGGMVTVTADGRGQIRELKIDPTVVDPEDVEMLEDLVVAEGSEAGTPAHTRCADRSDTCRSIPPWALARMSRCSRTWWSRRCQRPRRGHNRSIKRSCRR